MYKQQFGPQPTEIKDFLVGQKTTLNTSLSPIPRSTVLSGKDCEFH